MITTVTPILHHRLTYPLKRVEHAHPALCLRHVTLGRIPLGQPPALHRIRSLHLTGVRPCALPIWTVRLPVPVHHRGASLDFPMRSVICSLTDRRSEERRVGKECGYRRSA